MRAPNGRFLPWKTRKTTPTSRKMDAPKPP
jgi:hypothetical protein